MNEEIKRILFWGVIPAILAFVIFWHLLLKVEPETILKNTWKGYQHFFIQPDGRVSRPKENDTVSEAQSYAMLRAISLNDKAVFDRCYRWTEHNLSRKKQKGDNLLAWHWKEEVILDWMPASDADIDYALALVLADKKWHQQAPVDLEDYGRKAKGVLGDILKLETYSTSSGRFYLSPWIIKNKINALSFPVNPSYYSPAHFRIFYEYTQDRRWLELVNTTYYILNSLAQEFDGGRGEGLIPDWCAVDHQDKFYPLPGKNSGFGWEAVRIPFRIALDYFWFNSAEAKEFFDSGLVNFIEKEWKRNKRVFSEYNYSGQPLNKYENALFYAAYYCALRVNNSKVAKDLLNKVRSYLKRYKDNWFYQDKQEYYVNSLAWLAEALNARLIQK